MKDFFEMRRALSESTFPNKFQKDTPSKKFERYVAWNVLHRFKIKDPSKMTRQDENEVHNWFDRDPQDKGLRRWDRDILGDSIHDILFKLKRTGYKGLLKRGDM
jgi:hypothetical protein